MRRVEHEVEKQVFCPNNNFSKRTYLVLKTTTKKKDKANLDREIIHYEDSKDQKLNKHPRCLFQVIRYLMMAYSMKFLNSTIFERI